MSVYVSQALKTPLLRLDLRPLTPPLDSLSLSHVQPSERADARRRKIGRPKARVLECPPPSLSLSLSLLFLPRKPTQTRRCLFTFLFAMRNLQQLWSSLRKLKPR